ncbi:PAS domain S-box protein [Ideonella sp. BN130291]|uniref:PAS domain S-box protein n=1 Tax=Ideonella sp. BN130291 TaxID=3112940 RepID=UPI002E2661DD|nr:PAS domain S-box protein [Ideonella sp. BN130291]
MPPPRLPPASSSVPPISLRALIDASSDGVVVFDARSTVLLCNRAAMRLLACEPGFTLAQLEPVLGPQLMAWLLLERSGAGQQPVAPLFLADGRQVQASLQVLELGQWALRLEPARDTGTLGPLPELQALGVPTVASRQLLRLFWESPFPATVQDAQFKLVAVNQAYLDFTGFSREQLLGIDPVLLQPEQDRQRSFDFRQQLQPDTAEPALVPMIERRLIDAAGHERWFRLARCALTGSSGQPLWLSVVHDITAERVAREQADRSVRELDEWFDLSPVGMVLFDDRGLLLRSNPAFASLVGDVPEVVAHAPQPLQELLAWEDSTPSPALAPGAPPLERRVSVATPDGRRLRLRALVRGFATGAGQRRFMAVVEDRTLEEERELAQLEIGALMDTASIGIATFEESRGWVSSAQGKGSGKAGAAGLQSIGRDMVVPESLADYERLQRALKQGERAEVRYAVRHPELGERWLLTRVEPGQLASGRRTTSVVTLDVTDQEQARMRNEQLLRELSTLLDVSSAGIAYFRGDLLVRCNERFERMLGLVESPAGQPLGELLAAHPVAWPALRHSLTALRTARVFESEFRVHGAAGSLYGDAWYSLSVRRANSDCLHMEAVAVLTDISRLKKQQAELEELLRERELMFNLSEVGIAYVRGGRLERANQALAAMTGYATAELNGLDHAELFEDRAAYLEYRRIEQEVLRQQGRFTTERRLRRRDGSVLWVQASKRAVDEADPDAGTICSYVNVDERHRARQSLVLQAERTRAVLDSVLVGIVTVGERGIEWMNRSARRMFAGELADFVGEPISTVATPEPDHPLRRTHYLEALAEGQAEAFECRLIGRDGREFWVVGNAVVTGRESGERQLTFALLDIERRRQAEINMAQTQASLQRIIETAPLAIGLIDARTLRLAQLNQMAATFAGSTLDAAVGRAPEELFDIEFSERLVEDMRLALGSQDATRREYRRHTGGQLRVWDARYVPLAPAGASAPEQLLFVASDVTEQRAAEQARYEAAIAQREMLVKEVHHRIKNNLQGVAGLMQQIAQRRPEVAPVISEAIGQVQAIAQVYGLQVGAAGPLRIRSVLEAITASVQRMFGRSIVVEVQGAAPHRWALPEAESIPIALTLNELLTNAIKHSRDGDVRCALHCGDNQVSIAIANHGELPEGFSVARIPGGVSGLGLVRALLPRRSATLTLGAEGPLVVARITLVPPGITALESL